MIDEIITTKKLAHILGCTERRVQQLAIEGIIKKISRGKFHLADTIQKYIAYHLDLERKKFHKHDMQLNEARRRRETAEAFLKEIDLETRRGELVEREDVVQLWQKILAVSKTRLLSIPTKMSPQLVGMESVPEIKLLLEDEIHKILQELKDSKNYN